MAAGLSGLFINCVEANDSIHESGKMAYQCLLGSDRYDLDYIEITPEKLRMPTTYDFYLFNYHFGTMAWLDARSIKRLLPGLKMTLVLEVSPNDPFVYCSPKDFDVYVVLDPTLKPDRKNVYAFPRPLEVLDKPLPYEDQKIPVIGSFGFATPGKGFEHVIDAVNREFDRAVVRINIPYSTYMPESDRLSAQLTRTCKERAKNGVDVVVTHDYMSKAELIKWCARNTLNCFLYDRNMAGLAATTDQAITSGRPLITSKNNTFRHIQQFIKPFPYQSLREAIACAQSDVKRMQDAWSPSAFRERFEQLLSGFDFNARQSQTSDDVSLRLSKVSFVRKVRAKLAIRTRLKRLLILPERGETKPEDPKLSFSQFGEDLVIYKLFRDMSFKSLTYLDIGANDPSFFSNTRLLYDNGFSGVLVEPNAVLCEKLRAERPRDKVLNAGIGVGDEPTEADFYQFSIENSGLSTFSKEVAEHWQTVGMGGILRKIEKVIKLPLLNINKVIEDNFNECPDLISIDAEGWDLSILQSFDFERYNPAIFCVETLAYNEDGSTFRTADIYSFMTEKGYFAYHETTANTIFVNKNLYDFYQYQLNESAKRETAY